MYDLEFAIMYSLSKPWISNGQGNFCFLTRFKRRQFYIMVQEISKIHYWFSFFMCREPGRKSRSNNAALIYDLTCNNNYNC